MKSIIKNIVAPLILSGLFFIPVLSSAETSVSIFIDNNDKSQAEIEAIEQMQILEAQSKARRLFMSKVRGLFLKRSNKKKNQIFVSNLNEIYDNRSQAEVEAQEELLYIQIISTFRKLNPIDPVQAHSDQFSLISDLMASNDDKVLSVLNNLR
jgi:hypothetical protein